MWTSPKLILAAVSVSLIGCSKQITAEDAITIGRRACGDAEIRLSGLHGKSFQMHRSDWTATLDGREWIARAYVYPYHFIVAINASGTPLQCKWGHIDG
jgi:hypothetical protein